MTDKEAFKIGFLLKCAEEGLTEEQVERRILEKSAWSLPPIGDWVDRAASGAKWVADKAFWPAVVAPPLVGIAGAYALSKAQDDTHDVEEAKKREEIAAYRRAVDQLNRSSRKRDSF